MKGYPRWFRPTVMAIAFALYVTGCLLAPTTLQLRLDIAVPWRLGAGARIGMAALHATAALLAMLAIGALWSVHMRVGQRRPGQRRSGWLTVVPALLLAASAVGLYYLGDETWAERVALLHLVLGLALALPFIWHVRRVSQRAAGHAAAQGHGQGGRRLAGGHGSRLAGAVARRMRRRG
jgi:hypothetical protein